MHKLSLYVRTMRHLRPVQIGGRIKYQVQKRLLHPLPQYRRYIERRATGNEPFTPLTLPLNLFDDAGRDQGNSFAQLQANTVTFLNETRQLGEPINWFPAHATQLWQYNLHYFDYVALFVRRYQQTGDGAAYALFKRWVTQWLADNPLATPVSWNAYPLSLRLTNWIKAYSAFLPELERDRVFAAALRKSVYVQATFLAQHLEYQLLGNHLVKNGWALLYAGLFFDDARARRWRETGLALLMRELDEEFLADGGHYERSPMYHQILLTLYREVADVLTLQNEPLPPPLLPTLAKMERWLATMCHPDGQIALLNDAVLGIAGRVDVPISAETFTPLPESGYFAFRNGGDYLIFDSGKIGPDYFPGHAHCDTLSYELSLGGQRIIVDAGVGNYYGDQTERTYYRSTRAHNTVTVDGAEQSEIWGRFRVARRAQPLNVVWADGGSDLRYVIGSHSGYQRQGVAHRRWVCWVDQRFWVVCDQLQGAGEHQVESFIHLHPEVEMGAAPSAQRGGMVWRGDQVLQIVPFGAAQLRCHVGERDPLQGWVAFEMGCQQASPVWALVRDGPLPHWFGYLLLPDVVSAEIVAHQTDPDICQLTITIDSDTYILSCEQASVSLRKAMS